jgi:coatomer subunit beta'
MALRQIFEGHTHYIMALAINPKDPQTFASACLDHTVKVWSLGSPVPNFSLEAHEKGVNYVDYYHGSDKPYIVTTGDDRLVRIWDYHAKSCVQTLESHTANVSFAIFHPRFLLSFQAPRTAPSRSGTRRPTALRTRSTMASSARGVAYARPAMRSLLVSTRRGCHQTRPRRAFRVDGLVGQDCLRPQHRDPERQRVNLASDGEVVEDGARVHVPLRELGTTEVYPKPAALPNGRFVTVCGDGEYIIYTALAWRNKAFGSGTSFAWAADSTTYAVLEGKSSSAFTATSRRAWSHQVRRLVGHRGHPRRTPPRCARLGFVMFWDWETGAVVRRIEVDATNVSWSGGGDLVAITAEDSFYVLRFDRAARLDSGEIIGDEGVEEAFDIVAEVSEQVKTSRWVGDCFIYTNSTNRLNYLIGDQTSVINHFDQNIYLLGHPQP